MHLLIPNNKSIRSFWEIANNDAIRKQAHCNFNVFFYKVPIHGMSIMSKWHFYSFFPVFILILFFYFLENIYYFLNLNQ